MDPSTAHRCLPRNRTICNTDFQYFSPRSEAPNATAPLFFISFPPLNDDVDVAQIKHTTPTTPRRDNRQGSPSKNNDRPLGNQFIFLVVSKVTGSEQDQTIPASCSRFNRGHLQYLSSAPIGSCQNQISSQ